MMTDSAGVDIIANEIQASGSLQIIGDGGHGKEIIRVVTTGDLTIATDDGVECMSSDRHVVLSSADQSVILGADEHYLNMAIPGKSTADITVNAFSQVDGAGDVTSDDQPPSQRSTRKNKKFIKTPLPKQQSVLKDKKNRAREPKPRLKRSLDLSVGAGLAATSPKQSRRKPNKSVADDHNDVETQKSAEKVTAVENKPVVEPQSLTRSSRAAASSGFSELPSTSNESRPRQTPTKQSEDDNIEKGGKKKSRKPRKSLAWANRHKLKGGGMKGKEKSTSSGIEEEKKMEKQVEVIEGSDMHQDSHEAKKMPRRKGGTAAQSQIVETIKVDEDTDEIQDSPPIIDDADGMTVQTVKLSDAFDAIKPKVNPSSVVVFDTDFPIVENQSVVSATPNVWMESELEWSDEHLLTSQDGSVKQDDGLNFIEENKGYRVEICIEESPKGSQAATEKGSKVRKPQRPKAKLAPVSPGRKRGRPRLSVEPNTDSQDHDSKNETNNQIRLNSSIEHNTEVKQVDLVTIPSRRSRPRGPRKSILASSENVVDDGNAEADYVKKKPVNSVLKSGSKTKTLIIKQRVGRPKKPSLNHAFIPKRGRGRPPGTLKKRKPGRPSKHILDDQDPVIVAHIKGSRSPGRPMGSVNRTKIIDRTIHISKSDGSNAIEPTDERITFKSESFSSHANRSHRRSAQYTSDMYYAEFPSDESSDEMRGLGRPRKDHALATDPSLSRNKKTTSKVVALKSGQLKSPSSRSQKTGPGRPKKHQVVTTDELSETVTLRPRGRPPKSLHHKKRRGRPRKDHAMAADRELSLIRNEQMTGEAVALKSGQLSKSSRSQKTGPGRPRKHQVVTTDEISETVTPRPRGRPRVSSPKSLHHKEKRGRPKKKNTVSGKSDNGDSRRQRGRPRKSTSLQFVESSKCLEKSSGVKRGRGRPAKSAYKRDADHQNEANDCSGITQAKAEYSDKCAAGDIQIIQSTEEQSTASVGGEENLNQSNMSGKSTAGSTADALSRSPIDGEEVKSDRESSPRKRKSSSTKKHDE